MIFTGGRLAKPVDGSPSPFLPEPMAILSLQRPLTRQPDEWMADHEETRPDARTTCQAS